MMKKHLFLLAFFYVLFFNANAQNKKLTVGFGLNVMSYNNHINDLQLNGISGGYFFNLFYNINNHWSTGIEASESLGTPEINRDEGFARLSSNANISARGRYYFGDNKIRPHVGFGIGCYIMIPSLMLSEKELNEIHTLYSIGFSPEVGINFGVFQISCIYHISPYLDFYPEKKILTSNVELKTSFNLSFINR